MRAGFYSLFLSISVLSCAILPFTSGGKRALSIAASLLTAENTVAAIRVKELLTPLLADRPSEQVTDADVSSGSKPIKADMPDAGVTTAPDEASTMTVESTATAASDIDTPLSEMTSSSLPTLVNETAYAIDRVALAARAYPIETLSTAADSTAVPVFGEQAPQVLILHTHGTECYADGDTDGSYRTTDTEKNVVRVGKVLSEALRERGIAVLHCEQMFDADSFIKAYQNSKAAVRTYLAEYPSIRYVIDLHRDAAIDAEGKYVPLVTEIDGETIAKLMLVVGTDEAGAVHDDWRDNLRVAWALREKADGTYPTLMRPINVRSASFNQQLSTGYLLLEVGACGGTSEQACRAAELFARVFAETVTDEARSLS